MKLPKPTTEQAVILKDKAPCKIVVAVPGSGKTTLLFQAIQRKLKNKQDKCILVSFTKRVEAENILKVEQYFPQHKNNIKIQTFDSFCNRIIRDYWKIAGYLKQPEFDTAFDDTLFLHAYSKVEAAKGKLNVSCPVANAVCQYAITKQTTYKRSCKKLDISIKEKQLATIRQVSRLYSKLRRQQGIFLHNEVVRECLRLLLNHPDILNAVAREFNLFLVDELQDLTENQLRIATLIAEHIPQSVFVGDDAQTIYDFRGVRDDNIQSLQSALQGKLFSLTLSHRCSRPIAALATQLRDRIQHATPIEMQSNTEGDLPLLLGFKNKHKQYSNVAARIVSLHAQGVDYSNIAIIARLHESLAQIQRALQDAHVPVSTRFTQENDVKQHFQFLEDLMRLVFNGFCLKTLDTIFLYLNIENTDDHIKYIEKELVSNNNHERSHPNLKLKKLGRLIRKVSNCDSLESKVQYLTTFVANQYKKYSKHYLMSHLIVVNIQSRLINNHGELIQWIRGLRFEANSSVILLTTHASKGLEFDHVFVIDADDSRFPFKRTSKNKDTLDAEKKKLYVAITRSSKSLVITSLFNENHKPSKFITRIKGLKSLVTIRMNRKTQ